MSSISTDESDDDLPARAQDPSRLGEHPPSIIHKADRRHRQKPGMVGGLLGIIDAVRDSEAIGPSLVRRREQSTSTVNVRNLRACRLWFECVHGASFVEPNIGIELPGQRGLEVVALKLGLRSIDDADGALQAR